MKNKLHNDVNVFKKDYFKKHSMRFSRFCLFNAGKNVLKKQVN